MTSLPTPAAPDNLAGHPLRARRAWLGFSALALLAAGSAHAQSSGMGGRGHHKADAASRAAGSDAAQCATTQKGAPPSAIMVQGYVNERLGKLPAELGLNTDTAPLFERYARAMSQLTNDEVQRSLKAPQPESQALHAMDQQIAAASDRMAAWEEVQQAAKALMGQLSPEQRALANKRLVVSIEPKDWMDKATM